MTFDVHSLFAYSTIATAPSPAISGTSLTVQAGDGLKFGVPQNLTVCPAGAQPTIANSEIVRLTAISTDTFTITRTQEGSSARTIVVGDQIFNANTPKVLTDIEAQALGGTLTATSTNTLSNKTIAAGSNTISGLTNSNLSGSAGITSNNIASPAIAQTVVNNTQFSTSSTTYVDMTSASVSITTSANTTGKVLVTATCGWVENSSAALTYLALTDSLDNVLQSIINNGAYAAFGTPASLQYLVTGLSASTTYTYKLRCQVSAGTGYYNSTVITNGVVMIAQEMI